MRQSSGKGMEPKRNNKIRTAKFISGRRITSKAEIAAGLKLSMPTTLANVKELIDAGIVVEEGEYESTGGRRAKALSIRREAGYAVGVDITNNHITMVMADARKDITATERIRQPYENTPWYYEALIQAVSGFILRQQIDRDRIAGIGFSLPGIVDREQSLLIRSHTLQVRNVSMIDVGNALGYPFAVENDANSAAFAELGSAQDASTSGGQPDAVYLSLSNTVGGAIFFGNKLYRGENFKSAEFGHMVIEKNGRQCYCGKKGCVDVYCSAKKLAELENGKLERFFEKLEEGEPEYRDVWDRYLDHLAVTVDNLRMAFDCDVVLGGYVGSFIGPYIKELRSRLAALDIFDHDGSYARACRYQKEASALGAALYQMEEYISSI